MEARHLSWLRSKMSTATFKLHLERLGVGMGNGPLGALVTTLNTSIPWIMCQQDDAPANIINMCNGFYCDGFEPPDCNKPKMGTENWAGWYVAQSFCLVRLHKEMPLDMAEKNCCGNSKTQSSVVYPPLRSNTAS